MYSLWFHYLRKLKMNSVIIYLPVIRVGRQHGQCGIAEGQCLSMDVFNNIGEAFFSSTISYKKFEHEEHNVQKTWFHFLYV